MRLAHRPGVRRGVLLSAAVLISAVLLATSGDAVAFYLADSAKFSPISPHGRLPTTTTLEATADSTGLTLTATVSPAPGAGTLSIERCVDRNGSPATYDACSAKRLPNSGRWVVLVSDTDTDGHLQADLGSSYVGTGFRAVYKGGKGFEGSDSDPANYP